MKCPWIISSPCVPTSKCGKVGSISYSGGKMNMEITCCNTDFCSPPLPSFPGDSGQTNGLMCPTCRSTEYAWCYSSSTIECTGNEQICITESTTTSISSDSASGCATPSVCEAADYTYYDSSTGYYIYMGFYCYPATYSSGETLPSVGNTGTFIWCIVCSSDTDLTCSGLSQKCPANNICASAYRIIHNGGEVSYSIIRSCAPIRKCNVVGSMTVLNTYFTLGVSCCTEDYCTPLIPSPATKSPLLNTIMCKACNSYSSEPCEPDVMFCSGNENRCVTYNVTAGSQTVELHQGCGNKILCDYQGFSVTIGNGYMTLSHNFTCNTATPTKSGFSHLLLSITAIALVLQLFGEKMRS
ncbi:uncharacterized protein [Hyperolius riggenbachi]|uniref:uncharacterized protein n=1 Tax=Hyperolius riggenbachi TaxID=752182 RepID=UPI0035A32EA1